MKVHKLIFKGGLTVGLSQAVVQACSFIRNVIVARLISPQNYGIAATFAMTFYLLEMISNLGMETLLIQAEDGNEPRFEQTAHLMLVLRGLINAAFIFVLAGPISTLFGVPQARWAFRCLALTPLLKSWNHLDTFRFQREMRFGPTVTVDVSSSIFMTLAALPICWWRRDYSAMLCLLILQAASSMVMAHFVAERRYAWAWDARYARRFFTFGWPLLINGLLMYGIFQGDRFVIGAAHRLFARSSLTLTDLGVYSVAFGLTMAPTMLVANVSSTLFLPYLSSVQKVRGQFERRYHAFSQLITFVAATISIPFIVTGGWLVILIYGHKYGAAAAFIGWLGAMWALRIVRVAPTLAAMALGDTRNSMVSNIARSVALLGVVSVAATGGGLSSIAVCGFAGEVLALAVCVGRLQREHGVAAWPFLKPLALSGLGMVLAGLAAASGVARLGWVISFFVAGALILVQVSTTLFASPGLRSDLRGLALKSRPAPVAAAVGS